METIVRAMAEPESGLDIRDRVWLKIPIPKSFLGTLLFDQGRNVENRRLD